MSRYDVVFSGNRRFLFFITVFFLLGLNLVRRQSLDSATAFVSRSPARLQYVMETDGSSTAAEGERPVSQASMSRANSGVSRTNSGARKDGSWALEWKVKKQRSRDRQAGLPPRQLGLTWQNLTVKAISNDAAIHDNVASQLNIPRLVRESRRSPALKTILDNTHGCVKPGEMLLVLGRPGSGCTTLLSVLANRRRGYSSLEGDVFYGSMTPTEAKQYRGQIVMNTEDELFFPTLTVGQTMDFATRLKIPYKRPDGVTKEQLRDENLEFLLESMAIEHTHGTKVGNEFVRGVSGGERKRVSIIECMATRGSIFCWDNSTRGLDAST